MMAPKNLLLALAFSLLIPFLLYGQGQTSRDTTYFALQTKMIEKTTIHKIELEKGDRYQVYVQLKDKYHKKFKQATGSSIGKFFAVTYHGEILSTRLPVINTKITGGRFTIELFDRRAQADKIIQRIMGKDQGVFRFILPAFRLRRRD